MRSFTPVELAARTWWRLSPFKAERGLAARRYRELVESIGWRSDRDPELIMQAIGELARAGYHARALTPAIVGDRVARLRELPAMRGARSSRGLRPLSDVLAGMRVTT